MLTTVTVTISISVTLLIIIIMHTFARRDTLLSLCLWSYLGMQLGGLESQIDSACVFPWCQLGPGFSIPFPQTAQPPSGGHSAKVCVWSARGAWLERVGALGQPITLVEK